MFLRCESVGLPMSGQGLAHARFDALLENCVFYILRMYEFLHRVGHKRRISPFRNRSALLPNSGRGADIPERTLSARKRLMQCSKRKPGGRR
jgi:hypothetical protein